MMFHSRGQGDDVAWPSVLRVSANSRNGKVESERDRVFKIASGRVHRHEKGTAFWMHVFGFSALVSPAHKGVLLLLLLLLLEEFLFP